MPDPQTSNILLSVPTRGSDVGTWDVPVNGDFVAIDGYFGGVATVSLSNTNVTLTSPSGTVTATAGPTQAQNAVLRFTGAISTNIQITLPLPGFMIIENLTTGNFVLTFRAAASGEIIGVDQGNRQQIFNDGTNVRFVGMGKVGEIEIWAGVNAIPTWVTACTVPPYLLCDGSVYTFSTYPYLGKRLGSAFGGNGITTFGVPDLRGRVPLPFDGTGTRITPSGAGFNGSVLGAAGGPQSTALGTVNLPPYTPVGSVSTTTSFGSPSVAGGVVWSSGAGVLGIGSGSQYSVSSLGGLSSISVFTGTPQGGSSTPFSNVQPSQVTGIAVIRAA